MHYSLLLLIYPHKCDALPTYIVIKVLQTEFVGFGKELCALVHPSNVQNDVCPFGHPVAFNEVIF